LTEKRIGLFGGTFDPVHFGHLRPAVELAEHYALDVLYLLPNHRPGHRGPTVATTEQRIAMLELAVQHVDCLEIDAREAQRDVPTFTIDTLEQLTLEKPNTTFLFFMGMDSFSAFDSWKRWQDLLKLCNLVVVDRPDAPMSEFASELMKSQGNLVGTQIKSGSRGVIERVSVTQLQISATDLRRRAKEGLSLRFLVPEVTREYIVEHKLYCELAV